MGDFKVAVIWYLEHRFCSTLLQKSHNYKLQKVKNFIVCFLLKNNFQSHTKNIGGPEDLPLKIGLKVKELICFNLFVLSIHPGLAPAQVPLIALLFSLNSFPKHPSTQTKDKMVQLLLASNCPMRKCRENKERQNQGLSKIVLAGK